MVDMEDLLEQEEAYRKVNAELELRTRKLMKDVEEVMSGRSDPKSWFKEDLSKSMADLYDGRKWSPETNGLKSPLSDISSELDYGYSHSHNTISSRAKKRQQVQRRMDNSGKFNLDCGDLVPPTAKGMSAESLARFLKAKAKLLQEELDNSKRDFSRRTDEWRKCQQELKNSEDERVKLGSDLANAREKIRKQDMSISSITEKLHMRDMENAVLKKEIDMLKHNLKKQNLSMTGNDVKLNKAKEDVEKLKQALKVSQLNEKEAKEKFRAKEEEMSLAVGKLERHKAALISAMKKQIYLIDNLKKQKACLEVDGITGYTQDEFMQLLEWRPGDR